MNRLQVGGLALIIRSKVEGNVGAVVKLITFLGDVLDQKDVWLVECREKLQGANTGDFVHIGGAAAQNLLPLGDEKGIELYKLKEELAEEQSQ